VRSISDLVEEAKEELAREFRKKTCRGANLSAIDNFSLTSVLRPLVGHVKVSLNITFIVEFLVGEAHSYSWR